MGSLTWKNVTGQSTNAGSSALKNAGSLFGAAFDKFSGIAKKEQAELEAQNKAEVVNQIRQAQTEEGLQANAKALSPETLNERFGAGNINLSQIANAQDKQKATIRSDLGFEQRQTDRETRLAREAVLTRRQDKDYLRGQTEIAQQEAGDLALRNIDSDAEVKAFNDEIIGKSLQLFNEANPAFPGQETLVSINSAGEVVFHKQATEQDKESFYANVEKFGGLKTFQSLGQKQATLDTATQNLPQKIRTELTTALRDITNANNMSVEEKAALTDQTGQITTGAANELAILDQAFQARKSRIKENQTLSDAELQVKTTGLLDFALKRYPDPGFGSTISGNLGGEELTNKLQEYTTRGIVVNGTVYAVEPELLKQGMLAATVNVSDSVFGDVTVDEGELQTFLESNVVKQGGKKAAEYLDSLNKAYLDSVVAINNTTTQSIKELKARFKTSLGQANKDRNLNLKQTLANRAVNK